MLPEHYSTSGNFFIKMTILTGDILGVNSSSCLLKALSRFIRGLVTGLKKIFQKLYLKPGDLFLMENL
jgi:hypothetical protein